MKETKETKWIRKTLKHLNALADARKHGDETSGLRHMPHPALFTRRTRLRKHLLKLPDDALDYMRACLTAGGMAAVPDGRETFIVALVVSSEALECLQKGHALKATASK